MSKLPTAKDVLDKHAIDRGSITIGNFTCVSVSYEKALKAIESHTAAHTAALRSQIAQLDKDFCHCSAENSDLSSQLEGVRHDNDLLRERVKELEAKIASYESAIDGLKKVVDSLAKMKSL